MVVLMFFLSFSFLSLFAQAKVFKM